MSQPLFTDPTIKFEKVAYTTRLDDDPEEWPAAILRESYKQLPFLKSFETDLELERIDPSRGFAVGKMLVFPAGLTKQAAATGDKLISIPIIIRDREMAPLDVFSHKGSMRPLEEDDIEGVMFQPEVFKRTARNDEFGPSGLAGVTTPPNTDHQYNSGNLHKHGHVKEAAERDYRSEGTAAGGAGGALAGGVGGVALAERRWKNTVKPALADSTSDAGKEMVKLRKELGSEGTEKYLKIMRGANKGVGAVGVGALGLATGALAGRALGKSKEKRSSVSMWYGLANTFNDDDIIGFKNSVTQSAPVRDALLANEHIRRRVGEALDFKEKTAANKEAMRRGRLKPSVIQITEAPKGYLLKTANHRSYAPDTRAITRFEAEKALPAEALQVLRSEGRVTMVVDPVLLEAPIEKVASEVERLGVYDVWAGGKRVPGIVIPKMISLEGVPLGTQLFAGLEEHAMQEKVAGVFRSTASVPPSPFRGVGSFVYQSGPYAVATEPVEITNVVTIEKVATLVGRRLSTGEDLRIVRVPGLKKIAAYGNEVWVPEVMEFLPLRGKSTAVSSKAVSQVFEHDKVASASSVELISDGSSYGIRGANVSALKNREFLEASDAEFLLGALGIPGAQAQVFIKEASEKGSVRIARTRQILTESSRQIQELTKVASYVRSFPNLKVNLLKEAAVLFHPKADGLWKQASVIIPKETVDAILTLGFVTPENASLYVDYLPELQKTASKLAELLVASRLGMDEVRESAAKNAMTQVSAVVRGLETLREKIM